MQIIHRKENSTQFPLSYGNNEQTFFEKRIYECHTPTNTYLLTGTQTAQFGVREKC